MNEEHNHFPKRERTPKRRSSILKRQDTCMLTERIQDGDEGSRTPRRVSFAQNTMIKEFYETHWSSQDDSSLQSSKSSQSSSSSEEAHPKDYGNISLSQHNSLSSQTGQPTFTSESEGHYGRVLTSEQNKTICFQDMDSSLGNMNLTSNITELSMMEDALKAMPWLHREQQQEPENYNGLELLSASYRMQEYVTMEMTHNLHGTNMENTNRTMTYQRQLSEECTEDMELTADLMYSSRTALTDIPVNAPAGFTRTTVKFGRDAKEQENNPLLLLHGFPNPAISPSSRLDLSSMELTNVIQADSRSNSLKTLPTTKDPLKSVSTDHQRAIENVTAGSSSIQSSVVQCEERQKQRHRLTDHLTSKVLSPVAEMSGLNWSQASSSLSRMRAVVSPSSRESNQPHPPPKGSNTVYFGSPSAAHSGNIELTTNVVSDIVHQAITQDPCLETRGSLPDSGMRLSVEPETRARTGTNTVYFGSPSATHAGNIELTTNLTSDIVSNRSFQQSLNEDQCGNTQGSLPESSMRLNERPKTRNPTGTSTVYFGSPSAANMGNLEITTNITSDIVSSGSFQQALSQDQCQENRGALSDSNIKLYAKPQTRTIYFSADGTMGTNSSALIYDGDMELTATCYDPPGHGSNLGSSESASTSEAQAGTLYFDKSRSTKQTGEMELTETVPDKDDPDIVFNFRRNSTEFIQKELVPRISEDKVQDTQDSMSSASLSKERTGSLIMNRDNDVHLNEVSSEIFKASSSVVTDSMCKDTSLLQSFTSKTDHFGSSLKLEQKGPHVKKTQSVKDNIIKNVNGLLNFSRRTSISNMNGLNASRNLRGLLLSSQEKSKRKSNTMFPKLRATAQDEVDGMVGSAAEISSCSKANSSDIVSVFSDPHWNSKISSSKPSHITSPLKENTITNSSIRHQSICLQEQAPRSTSSHLSPTGPNCSASVEVNKSSSIMTAPPQPGPSTITRGRESPFDFTDLRDDPDMLLGDLNLQKLVGKCDVDEEALDDFLQNLDCMVPDADTQAQQTQELVTLEDVFTTVGFVQPSDVEPITFEKELEIASTGSELQAKVSAVPKLDTLQVFVESMESTVKRLKEENVMKRETVKQDLAQFGRLLSTEEKTKSAALEMCKACRELAQSQWWKQEAGHLIEFSTQREDIFERLNSDVKVFRESTNKCSDLASEIDQCLQEMSGIQDLVKDVKREEKRLSNIHSELDDLRLQSKALDERMVAVQKRSSELVESTETVLSGQERVKEQLWWGESLTEWTLLEETSQGMTFGFLFNTLVLQVQLARSSSDNPRISGVLLRSRLSASSKPWAKLSHRLAVASIDCQALASKYTSHDQLSQLLLDVSSVVCNCRQLSTEIRQAHFTHRVSIDGLMLDVYVVESKKRQKIRLHTQFETPCVYPNTQLSWTVTSLFGDTQSDKITEVVSQVSPGHHYLTQVLAAAEKTLSQPDR